MPESKPLTIWVLPCPFRKDGAPVLGTMGSTVDNVVVMRTETWAQLCKEIPALGTMKFRVGTEAESE